MGQPYTQEETTVHDTKQELGSLQSRNQTLTHTLVQRLHLAEIRYAPLIVGGLANVVRNRNPRPTQVFCDIELAKERWTMLLSLS